MHPYFHHTANDKRYLTNTVVLDHIGALPLLPLFLGKRIKHPDLSRTLSTGDQSETGKDEKTEGKEGGRREREREREIIVEKWLTTARQRRTLKIKGSRQTSQLGSGSSDVRKTANLAILWRFRQVGAVLYVLMQRTHRIFFAFTGRRRRISRGQLSLLHAS